jgi:hypothetical protein
MHANLRQSPTIREIHRKGRIVREHRNFQRGFKRGVVWCEQSAVANARAATSQFSSRAARSPSAYARAAASASPAFADRVRRTNVLMTNTTT